MARRNDNINADAQPHGLFHIEFDKYGKPIHIVSIIDDYEHKVGDLNIFSRVVKFAKRLMKSFLDFFLKASLLFKRLLSFV
jgi:hypothetical protein